MFSTFLVPNLLCHLPSLDSSYVPLIIFLVYTPHVMCILSCAFSPYSLPPSTPLFLPSSPPPSHILVTIQKKESVLVESLGSLFVLLFVDCDPAGAFPTSDGAQQWTTSDSSGERASYLVLRSKTG